MSTSKFLSDNRRFVLPVVCEEEFNLLDNESRSYYKYKVIKTILLKHLEKIEIFTDYCINLNWADKIKYSYKEFCEKVEIESLNE